MPTNTDLHSRTTLVDGIATRWVEAGEGVPVVLIHGIPTSPVLWRDVQPRVTGARTLAVEMVGYGESIPTGRDRDLSLSAQADHLLAWLDELGIDRAVLVGHDLGGGVAHIAAVRRPSLCAGLLLTNAVGYDSWPIPAVRALRRIPGVVARTPRRAMAASLAPIVLRGHDDLRIGRESLALHARAYAKYGGGRGLARQMSSLDVADTLAVQDRLPELRVPARVVWGAADGFQKIAYGERFARDLGTTVRRIERGRHFTPEDHPDVLAEEINGLVTEVAAG